MTSQHDKPLLAGVLGFPISHSLSPLIHTIWAQREQTSAYYLPVETPDDDDGFRRTVEALITIGFRGVNVTVPHKERALKIADKRSEAADAAGAANMLTFGDDGIYADNSDIFGFAKAVETVLTSDDKKARAYVLGAGGAARGVILALKEAGYKNIIVSNRTKERAEKLADAFSNVRTEDWSHRDDFIADADLIVNTTSLGMTGQPPLDVNLSQVREQTIVADIVYSPLTTTLLKEAQRKSLRTIDGLAMLMHQARPGSSQWFGLSPVVDDDLRGHLVAALERKNA